MHATLPMPGPAGPVSFRASGPWGMKPMVAVAFAITLRAASGQTLRPEEHHGTCHATSTHISTFSTPARAAVADGHGAAHSTVDSSRDARKA